MTNRATVGVMIVGLYGASASTLVAGYRHACQTQADIRQGSYWCAILQDYPAPIYNIVFSGWDIGHRPLSEVVAHHSIVPQAAKAAEGVLSYPAAIGPADYVSRVDGWSASHINATEAVAQVRRDIEHFRTTSGVSKVIVINASSPAYTGGDSAAGWTSPHVYAAAAVAEGADWVEFTPSDTISDALVETANRTGSRVAGRDGSTGQTILKLCLRDFLAMRGFEIRSWYSTNLIGNHDGLVLQHPDYNETKYRDKRDVLTGYVPPDRHMVDIRYLPDAGDNKEAWDCAFFAGWLGAALSLRINWHGQDSLLAAPLMLDIVAGLIRADERNVSAGLLKELGIFFKAPQGYADVPAFDALYSAFKQFARNS